MDIDSDDGDGDGYDPLLSSIFDAMNSVKEATADKIYQKIRREGNINFSKPQVDRALARALDYGIFEIHNNRYRIRDVHIDDEDTVYQKKNNKNREQTPYRSEDNNNRGDLNPEKDNQRYTSPSNEENQLCPTCGRQKNPKEIRDQKNKKKSVRRGSIVSKSLTSSIQKTKREQSTSKEKSNQNIKKNNSNDSNKRILRKRTPPKEQNRKRKIRSSSSETERYKKLRKPTESKKCVPTKSTNLKKKTECAKRDSNTLRQKYFRKAKPNIKPTLMACIKNKRPKNNKKKHTVRRRHYLEDEEKDDEEMPTTSKSSAVLKPKSKEGKSESDISESSERSEGNKGDNKNKKEEPSTSKNPDSEEKNKNKSSGKEAKNSSLNKESHVQESDWMDQPEPFREGTVTQTNNSFTLQPMHSLPFRNPDDTSYFT